MDVRISLSTCRCNNLVQCDISFQIATASISSALRMKISQIHIMIKFITNMDFNTTKWDERREDHAQEVFPVKSVTFKTMTQKSKHK